MTSCSSSIRLEPRQLPGVASSSVPRTKDAPGASLRPSLMTSWVRRPPSTCNVACTADGTTAQRPAKNKPLLLEDGTLLCPSSIEREVKSAPGGGGRDKPAKVWSANVESTTDAGRTWRKSDPIELDGKIIQPSLFLDAKYESLTRLDAASTAYSRSN
eukprot:scaffold2501_cov423-Prasinococcus_capsulatus_cf.AAC.10